MKKTKIDTSIEEKIITAMVISKEFLFHTYKSIDLKLIQSKPLKQIAKWCILYFNQYKEAPKENIESLYHAWARKEKVQEDMIEAVHDILENLSDRYENGEELNIPYLIDNSSEYFLSRRIEVLKEEMEYYLAEGNLNAISKEIATFSTITTKVDLGIDPLNNEEAWEEAFAESQKPLIDWKDNSANLFFGNALCRDSLIGILAPEKRGKTWWCIEFALRAVSQRKKVALFEVGDMSQSQILKRIGVRLSRRPMFKKDLGIIEFPKNIEKERDEITVENINIECNKVVNKEVTKKSIQKFLRRNGIKKGSPYLMISTHPNSSVNIQDINSILNQWENFNDFIPDIIIIDYPDILSPEPGFSTVTLRDQTNATWKALRRLSQEKHCLVIAPTQADAASYSQDLLDASNFSEDKRKLSHVTGMLGLNQTREEKVRNIMRLNWIVLRESDFSVDKCLYVGQCFKLGEAFCCSSL